jgi:hypothetical protein
MFRLAAWAALCALLPSALPAADPKKPGKNPAPPAIEQVAWLAGSWRMEQAGRVVEEQWMAPAADVMLGMSRTVAKGRVTGHEFMQIRVGPGGDLFYVAQPSGQKEAAFQHSVLTAKEVETISKLAELSTRLTVAIGRFKLGKEQLQPAAEGGLPVMEGSYPQLAEEVTTSDEEIKLGFVE